MTSTRLVDERCLLPLLLAAILSGCGGQSDNPSATGEHGSAGFERNLSARFSASITSDNEIAVRYEAPDGDALKNVVVRVVPIWRLQSVLDGMNNSPTTNGVEVRWDSLAPGESRPISLGEPPLLNDGVTSVSIEGTAELQQRPVRFAVDQRR